MSLPALRDLFIGVIGADYCARALLYLESPSNEKEYLIGIHKITFPKGDIEKKERWRAYPHVEGTPEINPIKKKDLSDPEFMNKQADRLSFDIIRFIQFLTAYTKVDDDINPIMLHYSMIYLFDFFSRTWLKYPRNWGHGIRLVPSRNESSVFEYSIEIQKNGIFPRAVDAFYFSGQSSLFSVDEDDGIPYQHKYTDLETPFPKIEKLKYSENPKIKLGYLFDLYERLSKIKKLVLTSNLILLGYAILFIISSISRYRAEDWFKIGVNRDLKYKVDLLRNDFRYEFTLEILRQTILKKGLKNEVSISSE